MRFLGQVSLFFLCCLQMTAQEKPAFKFKAPVVKESVFNGNLGMTVRERDDYASNLAIFAGNEVIRRKASIESLDFARRALGLAMHLSARNKRAVVLSFQLGKGVMPNEIETQYRPKTLASLYVTRAEILYQQKGALNRLLARYLIDLAVTMDPKNEDAVYAYEMQKIDLGEVPWKWVTDGGKPVASNP